MDSSVANPLKDNIRGEVLDAHNPDYDTVRALYNGMIDKRPRLIVRCVDVADVMAVVNYAREADLLVAVRGGGHSAAGLASCDDGLMIDLSLMRSVHVDLEAAMARAEPGCTGGDVDLATQVFGLAVPTGTVSCTGIAGLTLGGGHGHLTRQYGLTIDSLLEADVVLADGRLVTANEREHKDLYWALRGGGGNFGVVTSFLFKAHPVSTVYAGPVFWDIEHAREVLRWYRDFLPQAPVELGMFAGLQMVPSTDPFPREIQGRRICVLVSSYNGSKADGEAILKSMGDDLPSPILDGMAEMPFLEIQRLFDPLLPKGLQWYWKGGLVSDLTDKAIDVLVDHGSKSPTELSAMHLYPINGAVHRFKSEETAWSCRDAMWSMVIAGADPDPANKDVISVWAKRYWESVLPFSRGDAYVNFMMNDDDNERVKASYGDNYARLAQIKAKYDPDNFFRVNQNIEPMQKA